MYNFNHHCTLLLDHLYRIYTVCLRTLYFLLTRARSDGMRRGWLGLEPLGIFRTRGYYEMNWIAKIVEVLRAQLLSSYC
jgi:hypothetical protein